MSVDTVPTGSSTKSDVAPGSSKSFKSTSSPERQKSYESGDHLSWRRRIRNSSNNMSLIIEDFPQGYPRFSAFLASDNSFQVWRRFSRLRTRLLLLKQDKLSQLEEILENIDDREISPLHLSSSRLDPNEERKQVLEIIDDALKDYDSFIERHQRALGHETCSKHAVTNVQTWLGNTGALARDETEYLDRKRDLFSLLGNSTWSERLAEVLAEMLADAICWLKNSSIMNTRGKGAISNDENIIIRSSNLVTRDKNVKIAPFWVMRALLVLQASIIAALLLTPVIICNYVNGLTYRVIIVVLTTATFIAALSCLTRVRAVDLVIAGATYATVLVVFISGTSGVKN